MHGVGKCWTAAATPPPCFACAKLLLWFDGIGQIWFSELDPLGNFQIHPHRILRMAALGRSNFGNQVPLGHLRYITRCESVHASNEFMVRPKSSVDIYEKTMLHMQSRVTCSCKPSLCTFRCAFMNSWIGLKYWGTARWTVGKISVLNWETHPLSLN